ncbi:MAG TPA: hypothetical protein VIJ27_07950, partial [Mucilaginibacter sp.]
APLSPEKYIKTQARVLPIVECLVTEEWENVGICNIFIARQHITGNFTVGMYLVDLYCLGVKDTFYQFNITPEDYRYLKRNNSGTVKCEYALVHNIIYGAIEFAGDYGFKPHKEFSVSQFILEEDDEQVELMELDFGLDGLPCFVPGPNDDAAKIKSVTATLERTAGPGNFEILDPFDDDEFDDDEFGFDEGFDYDDLMEDLEESYARYPKILKKVNKVYDGLIRTPEAKEIIEKSSIGTGYKIIRKGKVKNEYTIFDSTEQEEEYNQLRDMVIEGEDYGFAIKSIRKAIKKHSDKPAFYDLLIPCYNFSEQYDEQNKLVTEMYKLFPDYLLPKIGYANLLIDSGKAGEVPGVFKGKGDLNYICSDRKTFHLNEAADYYATMCRHFIAMDNIDQADLYMDALFKKKLIEMPGKTFVNIAIMELINAKMKKITEKSALSGEW